MNLTLGDRLRILRRQRRLKGRQVGEAVGIGVAGYFSYEAGRTVPNPDMLIKLCNFFNTTPNALLGWQNEFEERHNADNRT